MPARMLVVEDNPTNMELILYLLKAFGYESLTAISGEKGIDAARRELPDLILCDIQLPGIDGYEVVRQVKKIPALRAIPLIAITAYAMVGDREKILAAGFDGYIPKPITPETFIKEVETFLPPLLRATTSGTETGAQQPTHSVAKRPKRAKGKE